MQQLVLTSIYFLIHFSFQQEVCKLDFITDLTPADCYASETNKPGTYYAEENCLPICKAFPNNIPTKCNAEGLCTDTKTGAPIPGTKCNFEKKKCETDPDTCAIHFMSSAGTKYKQAVFKPKCNADYYWAAKQCKGDTATGRCFCFGGKGKRLFGNQWADKAKDMTCSCSRRKEDLQADATNNRDFISFHCDDVGNYEPLQCDVDSEQCWCADAKTGEPTSTIVPQTLLTRLPCYDILKTGGQYLRQCESKDYAQKKILSALRTHGTNDVDFGRLLCDGDGSYGAIQFLNGVGYCTWKDGSKIGTWQSDASIDPDSMTCNCARDSKIYELAGKPMNQQCDSSGEYKRMQTFGTYKYCVDKDGFKKNRDDSEVVPLPQQDSDCDIWLG